MTLTHISSAAVRIVNAANGIKLTKVAEFGDTKLGAVVYKDKEWCEYRVMYFADGEHLTRADYHTSSILPQDKADALAVAEEYALGAQKQREADRALYKMEDETDSAIAAVEADAEERTVTTQVRRTAPRGYYEHPSPLLKGLLMRTPYVKA